MWLALAQAAFPFCFFPTHFPTSASFSQLLRAGAGAGQEKAWISRARTCWLFWGFIVAF